PRRTDISPASRLRENYDGRIAFVRTIRLTGPVARTVVRRSRRPREATYMSPADLSGFRNSRSLVTRGPQREASWHVFHPPATSFGRDCFGRATPGWHWLRSLMEG